MKTEKNTGTDKGGVPTCRDCGKRLWLINRWLVRYADAASICSACIRERIEQGRREDAFFEAIEAGDIDADAVENVVRMIVEDMKKSKLQKTRNKKRSTHRPQD